MANQLYLQRTKQIARAKETRSWRHYVWLHERPYRPHALIEVAALLPTAESAKLIGDVYRETENFFQYRCLWLALWSTLSRRKALRFTMAADEFERLQSLPETVVIYRGCTSQNRSGLSWTLCQEKATWFARRFPSSLRPLVLTASVPRDHIYALFLARDEQEVVVPPNALSHISSIHV